MRQLRVLFWAFLRIGAFTFGGGYAMVALLEDEFVTKKQWIGREEFLDMVAIAESTPGPVAINSATYIGYRVAGVAGSAAATLAVSLPSFVTIYLISLFFDQFLSLRLVHCAFRGIQAAVIYLIFTAGLRMLRALPGTGLDRCLLILVFCATAGASLCAVSLSSICVILLCGAAGVCAYLWRRLRERGRNA